MTKFCTQCGAEVAEAQKFCNKCGNRMLPTQPTTPPVTTQDYQPQGTAPTMHYQQGYPPVPQNQQSYGNQSGGLGLTSNLIGALCYFVTPITAIIFLVLDPYNKDRFVRFHAWQAIFFAVAWVVLKIALGILYFILPGFLAGMLSGAIGLGFFIGWIWLMVQAYQNRMEKLPVIGDLAEQQAR